LKAGDFDKRTKVLTIGKDKNGKPRQIAVPQNIADFLTGQVKDKLPTAPIFMRADGRAWNKDSWKGPIKDAVTAAKLPTAVSAYTLRHCVITDLVNAGLPVLTVAQISGTSIAMIQAHYGHLVGNAATEALAGLAL
ncbi:MAG: tyrosine-type recombinase/integrase, partial [Bdellovibrionales bacterium]